MRFFTYNITILILVFFLVGSSIAHAQIPVNDLVQIESNTDNPKPFQQVTVDVKSYSTDVNSATISWYVNKKLAKSGVGVTSFSFTTGKAGSVTTIDVTIKTTEGVTMSKSLTVEPADVDLVWEAVGITPPFYKGMPVFIHEGDLKFTAIPNLIDKKGNRLDPAGLIYTWKLNYKVIGESSGYGKQRLQLKGGVLIRDTVVEVDVTSPTDSSLHAQSSVSVDAYDPEIVFYEDNPLYGVMYNKAIPAHYNLQNSEVKIVSVPYFFSNSSQDALSYTWSINNLQRPDLANTTSVTLRAQGDTEGSSLIDLKIDNLKDIFQTAENSFTVNFSKDNNKQSVEF